MGASEIKAKLKSATLWINAAGAFAAQVLGVLQAISPETSWVVTALAVANFALRFKTTQPIV
jgi:hypothetical protein